MPFIQNFKSTDQWKAFTLNSIAASLTVVIAITTKQYLDKFSFYNNKPGEKISSGRNIANIAITLLVTFSTAMIVYLFMFLLFGFGGGMLASS